MRPVSSVQTARSVDEALELATDHDEAAYIAGGQSLTQMLKQRIVGPDVLINIQGLTDLSYVEESDERVTIGALTTHNEILDSPVVNREFPAFISMLEHLGDEQVRNMGTIGGDIAQSDPSSDYPPLTVALEAEYEIRSPDGRRTVSASEFFDNPYENSLDQGELLTEIRLPKHARNQEAAYEKFCLREGDFAMASVGARMTLDDGTCIQASLIAGAVARKPVSLPAAADSLEGRELSAETIESAAETARDVVDAVGDPVNGSADYKSQLVYSLTKDVLDSVADRLEVSVR